MHHPAVQFVAPYRIYVPDQFFTVRTDEGDARVKAVPLPAIQSTGTSQVYGANVEIVHDIFGFAGRTKFFVVLDQQVDLTDSTWKNEVCNRDQAIVDTSLRAVNRVIEVYRDRDINRIGVRSFHVLPLVRGDLSDVGLVVVDNELNVVPEFAINWPAFARWGSEMPFGGTVALSPISRCTSKTAYLYQSIES